MERKPNDSTTDDTAERVRRIGERADLHAKRAAFNLRRAAAALRANGYGASHRRDA